MEFDYYLKIAGLWDSEDIQCPPHQRGEMKKEIELADELGVERSVLKEFRREGLEGWVKGGKVGNWVSWTEEGETRVRDRLKQEMDIEELPDPVPVPSPSEFIITKIPLNSRLVICGDVYVKVKDNKNFLKGMKLSARPPVEGRSWVMVGRCPRYRGKY